MTNEDFQTLVVKDLSEIKTEVKKVGDVSLVNQTKINALIGLNGTGGQCHERGEWIRAIETKVGANRVYMATLGGGLAVISTLLYLFGPRIAKVIWG